MGKIIGVVSIVIIFNLLLVSAWNFEDSSTTSSVTVTTLSGNFTNISQAGDTDITYPSTDGYVLSYNDITNKWEPRSAAAVGDTNCSVDNSCSLITYDSEVSWNTSSQMINAVNISDYFQIKINYSNVLNHPTSSLTWANVVNGTLYLTTNPFGFYNDTYFPYTHLTNFTDDLGDRGYNSLSNFSNDVNFVTNATVNKSVYCGSIEGAVSNLCTLTASGEETDPLWADNFTKYNSTWSIDTDCSVDNSCSLITYDSEVSWNTSSQMINAVNISDYFQIKINYSNVLNHPASSLIWANAINGTLYLSSNPFTFWNATYFGGIGNWTNDKSSYYTASEIETNFSGYSTTTEMNTAIENSNTSLKNYVDAQDYGSGGLTWANAINGTLYLSSNPFTFWNATYFGGIGNWTQDKPSYYTASEIETNFSGYSTTTEMNTAIENSNTSLKNHVDAQNYLTSYTETDPLWADNFTKYNSTWSIDTDSNLTEDDVEAYIFDSDNTANLGLNGYNITNVSYQTFCNGANCWRMYVNSSDWFIIEGI